MRFVESFFRRGDHGELREFHADRSERIAGGFFRISNHKGKGITDETNLIFNEDRLISVEQGRRLHAAIPGSRLMVIRGCGHIPQEERPAETYAAIRNFLAGCSPAR